MLDDLQKIALSKTSLILYVLLYVIKKWSYYSNYVSQFYSF